MVMSTEVVSLMEGAWSCYTSGQYNGGRTDHVTEVCQFNGGRMVMLQKWSL